MQAAKDGFKHVWIDTVCINKESSAELTEAINSMWRLYCDAEVCYTLLSDLDANCPELRDMEDDWASDTMNDPESHAGLDRQFAASRWLERGWTLQELLAPRNMVFFGSGWNPIGTKHSLLNRLHAVTGIDKLALEDRHAIDHFVIARKMCWAANRRTTRIEDRAYSLLGIFGVNMPMLYGEGESAFIRLQEELIKNSTDHSIFAWEWTREPKPRDDLLFATSPDQFYPHGKRMIYWVGNLKDNPFSLTNRGIVFERISMKQKREKREPASLENEAWAILNCRRENDSNGIALRLVQKDHWTPRIDRTSKMTEDVYWVPFVRGETRIHSWKKSYPHGRRSTLLRHHLVKHWSLVLPPKFRIELDHDLASSFAICECWPSRLWEPGRDMMSLPPQKTYPEVIVASASIRLKAKGSVPFLHVAFSFRPVEEDGHHSPRLALSRLSQENARENLERDSADLSGGLRLSSSESRISDPPDEGVNDAQAHDKLKSIVLASAHLEATEPGDLEICAKIENIARVPEDVGYKIELSWAESTAELKARERRARHRRKSRWSHNVRLDASYPQPWLGNHSSSSSDDGTGHSETSSF